MWTKDEVARLKRSFWTAFGQYMQPVSGANGTPQKWLNYPTGVSGLFFRAFAGKEGAFVGIEIADSESSRGEKLVAQLIALKGLLATATGEEWSWLEAKERGAESQLWGVALPHVSLYKKEDWPAIISFFKPRLRTLDAFWQEARWGFEL